MDISLLKDKIVIIKDEMKESLLELLSSNSSLFNIKIITLSELKKKYYFDYDKKCIYYICNKYKVHNSIAKIYLDNLYYLNDFETDKIKFLKELKSDLDSNDLLIYDDLFKNFLNSKDIVLFDLKYVDNFYKNIFNVLSKNNNIIEYDIEKDYGRKDLYCFNDLEEEIDFVCSKICKLIKNGIDINRIKLSNVNKSNVKIIKRKMKEFNICFEVNNYSSVKGSNIIKTFKENYSNDITLSLKSIEDLIQTESEVEIYKNIIDTLNNYYFASDYNSVRELVFSDLDNIKLKNIKYKNSVKVVDVLNEIINEDDYVFLINYNEGVFPVNYKDEEYLSDFERKNLGISTSIELNKSINNNIYDGFKRIKNLIVTYSKNDSSGEIYISSSYNEELFNKCDYKFNYSNSNLYNINRLVSLLDEYKKYGSVSEELFVLNNHYKDLDFFGYSNKYSKIPKKDINEYMNNELSLSYSSLNTYYECAFKYYLNNILHLNKYEDTFDIVIGNVFHHILSKYFIENSNFEDLWNYEIESCKYEFNNMEKFFLDKLKEELILIIDTIKNQLKYTSLSKTMYEKEIIIDVNKDLHITFKGYVDKILYDEFNGETIVAIVDYKTGNPNININNIKYGLDMQLPIYMYLIKNSNIVKNVRIGGFYLQKILNNKRDLDERIESLKLQGYSNSDVGVLSLVDSSFNNSCVIKSLKTSSNGFYAYSKVLNDSEFDIISNIVKDKVNECSNSILSSNFDINPKMINGVNKSCKYCKFNDICYMRNEDIVNLKEIKNIFGGEE